MSTENAKQIERLIRNWPSSNLPDSAMVAYAEAVAGQDQRDVAEAVTRLVSGQVKRTYPELIPPPGALGPVIIACRKEREDNEYRNRPRIAHEDKRVELPPAIRKEMADRLRAVVRTMPKEVYPSGHDHRRKQQEFMQACIGGDPEALANLQAENRTIRLSDESLASLGIAKKEIAA